MSRTAAVLLLAVASGGVAAAIAATTIRRRILTRPNHRGAEVSMTLGIAVVSAVVAASVAGLCVAAAAGGDAGRSLVRLVAIAPLAGLVLVAAAGLYDDLSSAEHRGLTGHLRAAVHGKLTPGVVKLAAAVAAGGIVVLAARPDAVRGVLAVPVIAGSANVWNLLDLRPGRALKWFILVGGVLLVPTFHTPYVLVEVPALAAAIVALPFDLLERAMLGDTGANGVGFVIGVALFAALPTWGLAIALVAILVIHAVSETLTLSRVIDAAPPLRWFDGLGRVRHTPVPSRDAR